MPNRQTHHSQSLGREAFAVAFFALSDDISYEDTTGKYGSGRVDNVQMCCFTGKTILTGIFNWHLFSERGRLMGEYGLWGEIYEFITLGVNYHKTPFSGRSFEYCSEDPNLSYMVLVPEAIALQEKGVACQAKHASGNDQETMRIGVTVFFNEQAWREGSLRAAEGAFRKAHVTSYMQNYERLGLKSTMRSEAFNEGVVRGEWGFEGSSISDCTNAREDGYQGDYIDQIAAGTDRICMTNSQLVKAQVLNHLSSTDDGNYVKYVERAAKNYLYEFTRTSMMNGLSSNTIIRHITPWWQTAFTVAIICFAILTALSCVMMTVSKIKARKH